jgi:hypothetical protein
MLVRTGIRVGWTTVVITSSSSEVLPARSPMPFIVTSACRAPAMIPASVLAVASPRSSWQWVEKMTSRPPGVFSIRYAIVSPYMSGVLYPTVSGMFSVVAPAAIATPSASTRNSRSDRPASSGENSMSSHLQKNEERKNGGPRRSKKSPADLAVYCHYHYRQLRSMGCA